jgi:hypothetical protein
MSLPILTLEENALSPRLGYVFHRRWLQPYESVVGILWKFARMNLLPGASLVRQLCGDAVDPYEGMGMQDLDAKVVARLLDVPQRSIRAGLVSKSEGCNSLRFCPLGMSLGYHGVVHQRERQARCPIHQQPLLVACLHCGRTSDYWLDAELLDAPFRCRHCRPHYGYRASALPCVPLTRRRRIAVTRAALG